MVLIMAMDDFIFPAAAVGLLGVAVMSGGGNALGTLTGSSGINIKEMQNQLALEQLSTASAMDAAASRAAIAQQRYEQGCVFHVRVADQQQAEHESVGLMTVEYMPVVEGDTPRHHITGERYGRGTLLCDVWGNTALIDETGAATDAAFYGGNVRPYIAAYFGGAAQ
jgi:hypothetical protein